MRKLLSLFLVLLFLVSMTTTAFGTSNKEIVLAYLTEKYGVPEENIEVHEGGITELEFTGESFWFASYIVFPEGKPESDILKREKTLPEAEPMPLPAPDMAADGEPAVMPIPPQDAIGKGNIYGDVYIRIKTGEILELNKMEAFFSAESRLAQQEWERLRKEAGKLDVSLYRKLQGLSAAEKVTVSIQPAPVETDDIRAQFEALKKKYPELTSGMELTGILPYGHGYDLPVISGEEVSSSVGTSDYGVSEGDAAVSYIVPEDGTKSVSTLEKPDAEILPIMPDEKSMKEYNAMWEELDKIRLQAVSPSLTAIKDALGGMKAANEDKGTYMTADLTAEQINNIAKLSAVAAVYEEVTFIAMDASEVDMVRSSAPNAMVVTSSEAVKDGSASSYLIPVLIMAALLTAALVVFIRRASRNNN